VTLKGKKVNVAKGSAVAIKGGKVNVAKGNTAVSYLPLHNTNFYKRRLISRRFCIARTATNYLRTRIPITADNRLS